MHESSDAIGIELHDTFRSTLRDLARTGRGTMANLTTGLLEGKNCVVMGVLNKWSIGWAIAEAMSAAGGKVAITYLDERSRKDADAFIAANPGSLAYQCDVESEASLDALGESLKADFGRVDSLVHSIGFAPASELKNRFLETTRDGFKIAHSVSVYSLIGAAQRVVPLMTDGGSILTLTYLGSD